LDPYGELRLSSGGEYKTVAVQGTVDQQSASLLDSVRMQAFCDQMDAFATMIEGKSSHIGSGEDGRTAVALCLALLEASRSSRTVDMRAQK
jgi:predicted dehydrogenase